MKRVAVVLCAVWLAGLTLLGCGKKVSTAKPVTTGFSCDVSAQFRGMTVKGTLTRQTDGVLRVQLTEPPTLRDVAVSWDGQMMTMALGGVNIPVDAAKVPQGALVRQVLSALTASPTDSKTTAEGALFTGTVDGKEYTIVCAPDTGLIRSLSIPQDALTVSFDNTKTIA